MTRHKDKWVYWVNQDRTKIRIVKNSQVVLTLPKDPEKLFNLINTTTFKADSTTKPTQEIDKKDSQKFAYHVLDEPLKPINNKEISKDTINNELNKLMKDILK